VCITHFWPVPALTGHYLGNRKASGKSTDSCFHAITARNNFLSDKFSASYAQEEGRNAPSSSCVLLCCLNFNGSTECSKILYSSVYVCMYVCMALPSFVEP
jgi:hypothetical protein